MKKGKLSKQRSDSDRPAAYNHAGSLGIDNSDWMGKVSDNISLSQLSIPGTHDSMSFHGGDIVQCQAISLENQLTAGVRVLDIRCRHMHDEFFIFHGIIDQDATFDDVLKDVKKFLATHPSETVYMRVKEEGDSKDVSREFEETFQIKYWNSDDYKEIFWQYAGDNPKLGETRGKVVLLQNFSSSRQFGILWNSFSIQDNYHLTTNWDLYDKWLDVKSHLKLANEGAKDAKYINFLSGSGGSFPYFVASGQSRPGNGAPRLMTGRTTPGWKNSWPDFPRVNCFIGICSIAFEGTNILAAQRIGKDREFDKRTGILMVDFPGWELLKRIVELNY